MKYTADYLDYQQCATIKGFFIILVFVSHFMQYVAKAGGALTDLIIGQLMVSPFLFYSGLEVMEGVKQKGKDYVASLPRKRMLSTLLNFDIAVIIFIVVNLLLGQSLSVKQILLSFVCLDSVGNSYWYIFIILICYLIVYVAARGFRRVGFVTMGISLLVMLGLSFVRPTFWYDTILCFPVGVLYSEYRSRIDPLFKRKYWLILSFLLLIVVSLLVWCPIARGIIPNIKAIAFALLVVLLSMRFPVRHRIFEWLGRNLFPLYIYQRIPMLVLFSFDPQGFANSRGLLYFVLSGVITILIARLYYKWQLKFR